MRHRLFHHYVFPHHKTHKKAHLLSEKALFFYIGLFLVLQLGFKIVAHTFPGVLGTISVITKEEIVALTNNERSNTGLTILRENTALDEAAEEKAKNMFAENYWAHMSPSGKSPWVWIQQSGYNYRFAGENLARGFSTSGAVVSAWMASKQGHKENVLKPNIEGFSQMYHPAIPKKRYVIIGDSDSDSDSDKEAAKRLGVDFFLIDYFKSV